ncbi:MAG TPA: TM2 domain-containing protein [Allosphingosinicella sp.]|jgi:TM2 domain-containing membrane protein YozV
MRGQVLGVDTRTGDGIVTGEDGRRYSFKPLDWAARGEPAVGMEVDFETHERRALSIFPVPGASPPPVLAPAQPVSDPGTDDRNRYVAAVLAFFLGIFGVHRFYQGRVGSGIAMLLLTCTLVGVIVTAPWAFIDMIRYLVMSDREFADEGRRG